MKIGPPIPFQILKISAPDTEKGAGSALSSALDLKVGQLLKATVLGTSEDGLLQLIAEGRTIMARSQLRFVPGAEVLLEVHQEGEPPLLSVAAKEMVMTDLLRNLFSNSSRIKEILSALDPVLVGGSQPKVSPDSVNESILKEFWSLLSGFSVNRSSDPGKILAVLKAFSADKDAAFYGKGGRGLPELQEMIKNGLLSMPPDRLGREEMEDLVRLGQFLESIKAVNSQFSTSEKPDFFIFPCFFSTSAGWGSWMFSAEKDDGDEASLDRSYNLDFFLDMSRLGEIQLSIQVGQGGIRGIFLVEKEDVREFLDSMLGGLKQVLLDSGYSNVVLGCRLSEKNILQGFKDTVEVKGGLSNLPLVNVQV